MRNALSMMVACLFSVQGLAQDEGFVLEPVEEPRPVPEYWSEVELGIGYNSDAAFKYGEYTGLVQEGAFAIGRLRYRLQDPANGDRARYLQLDGVNLGLVSRSMALKYGDQGRYRVDIGYDQLPRFQTEDALSPYRGIGTDRLALPNTWQAATTTDGMTTFAADSQSIDLDTERKRLKGGLRWNLDPNWTLETRFRHEDKEGLDSIAGAFATNGGNPSAVILPEPIDYETNALDIALGYASERGQFQIAYELSLFNNRESSLTFQNPYSESDGGADWADVTGYPTGFGQMALPPDNQAHHLTLSGGYNFGNGTRMTANLSYGRLLQDETFLPFSAIAALNASVTTPLPRDSLDGRIDTLLLDLGLSSRPLRKLDLRANYRYEEQDNKTPRDIYVGIVGDAQTQPAGLANENARINLPYGYEKHRFSVDAGYRIRPRTKLTLGYQYDQRQRHFQEVDKTREHTVRIKASATPLDNLNGWVEVAHGVRDGSDYIDNAPFLDSHTAALLETLDEDERFENHPSVRKFHLADRDRDAIRARITLFPDDRLTFGVDGSYIRDDYDGSDLGLDENRIYNTTLDASYGVKEGVNTYVFLTHENLRYEQRGHSHNPFALSSLTDPAQRWSAGTEDRVYTAGVGARWSLLNDRLDVDVAYSFSTAETDIDVGAGSALDAEPLPDLDSRLHRVDIRLGYQLRDNITTRLGYRYESLDTEDFARDGINPDTIPAVLTLDGNNPDYKVHTIGISLIYKF